MFGLDLPKLVGVLVVVLVFVGVGVAVGIVALVKSLGKRRRQKIAGTPELPLSGGYAYKKDPRALTTFLKIMLWIYVGVTIVSILSSYVEMDLLSMAQFSINLAQANDLRQCALWLLHAVTFVITGIAFLRWIYRANSNCHGFGAQGMKFSPGWSVGWYFIPIVLIFMPYQAMKEIWRVSRNPEGWQNESGGPLLRWWWGLWIASNIFEQLSIRMSLNSSTMDALMASTVVSIASDIVTIALCVVGISLISAISLRQKRLTEMKVYESIAAI